MENSGSGSSVPIEENSTQDKVFHVNSSRSVWFYGTVVGTLGWLFLWITALLSAPAAIGGILLLISWPTLPLAIIMDSRKSGFFTSRKRESIAYILLSVVPLLALVPGAAYLYRRENVFPQGGVIS